MVDFSSRPFNTNQELLSESDRLQDTVRQAVMSLPLQPVSRDGALPLSFAQQQLWFLDQLEPHNSAYNIREAFRLTGPLNVPALEQSFNEIVRRHESLRTSFAAEGGLDVVDLQEVPKAEREKESLRLATEQARRPFDLSQAPLLRSTLLRLNKEEHMLLLTLHHIVSDGWSTGVLFRELKPSPLPELPLQYADFALWQREWLQGEVLQSQLSYWKGQLEGIPPVLEMPTDRPRPAVQTFRGAKQSVELGKALTEALGELSRREGVTLFMTLLAAFQVLLCRYTGQEQIVVGSPIANRNRAEIEGLIGFFVNTLALRTDLSGEPSFRELLARVREVALGAYAHQDLPFERLVEELQVGRDLSRNPLFQVMFVLQNGPGEGLKLPELSLTPVELSGGTAKFDLTLSLTETERGLRGSLEYDTELFDSATIRRMLGHYQRLLEGMVVDADRSISALELLTEAEREQLLVEWNDTRADYPEGLCIHELFEAQVERTPDAIAVVFEGEELTYGELNRRANRLAHYLRRLGVGPEVLVGICVERSLEMVVGLLGILKAGGAYVPLDPEYPRERLEFMLEDAQIPVLLTQQRLMADLPIQNRFVWTRTGDESQPRATKTRRAG
jgi:non-ribosomal peptide synthetase component F